MTVCKRHFVLTCWVWLAVAVVASVASAQVSPDEAKRLLDERQAARAAAEPERLRQELAQREKELADALARIKVLEAELYALRAKSRAAKMTTSAPATAAAATQPIPATDVISYARTAIRAALKNPNGAKFPLPESGAYGVSDLGAGRYRVSGYVDATNAFNATVRERWVCEIELMGADQFKPTYMKIGDSVVLGVKAKDLLTD